MLNINIDNKYYFNDNKKKSVLKNIHYRVDSSDFVSILGLSGVGKTTLLRIVLGLEKNYKGEIKYDAGVTDMSMVFQEHRLLPWLTAEENIRFVLPGDMSKGGKDQRVEEILELVGLKDSAKLWVKELSGGMAQRVSIARALVVEPSLLLLDEPFASLDAFTKMEIQQELKKIVTHKRVTCMMVTHDFDEAIFLSNKIVILGGEPATINLSENVRLKDPSDRTSFEFNQIRKRLYDELFKK